MRRHLDAYYTPAWVTRELLARVPVAGKVLEPCAGTGSIASVLRQLGAEVVTNDIDAALGCDHSLDATGPELWGLDAWDWVVSNPPFGRAVEVVRRALDSGAAVAMLLRLSFLEPVRSRAWLAERPPTQLIVLPRVSFTADGRSDSVTTAWMVWSDHRPARPVDVVPRRGSDRELWPPAWCVCPDHPSVPASFAQQLLRECRACREVPCPMCQPRQEVAVGAVCQHHWLVEPARGESSVGVCRRCGEAREFRNWLWDRGENWAAALAVHAERGRATTAARRRARRRKEE